MGLWSLVQMRDGKGAADVESHLSCRKPPGSLPTAARARDTELRCATPSCGVPHRADGRRIWSQRSSPLSAQDERVDRHLLPCAEGPHDGCHGPPAVGSRGERGSSSATFLLVVPGAETCVRTPQRDCAGRAGGGCGHCRTKRGIGD